MPLHADMACHGALPKAVLGTPLTDPGVVSVSNMLVGKTFRKLMSSQTDLYFQKVLPGQTTLLL